MHLSPVHGLVLPDDRGENPLNDVSFLRVARSCKPGRILLPRTPKWQCLG
jgi:hypothetical protein